MKNRKKIDDIINIFIVPHYIGSLKYFDKLYEKLNKEKINVVYILNHHNLNQKEAMESFCKKNNRNYEILEFKMGFLSLIFRYYTIYNFRKSFEHLLKKYNPKLIIQYNDVIIYNDSVTLVGKKYNISTFVLQWAVTHPQILFQKQRIIRTKLSNQKKSFLRIIFYNVIMKYIKILNIPLHFAFKTSPRKIVAFAMGESDHVGVFNEYTKKILINNGLKENKIQVLGSLDYDDAIKAKYIPREEIIEKYNLKNTDFYVVYFSVPFYTKDITFMTLEAQLDYTKNILEILDNFFKKRKKTFSFIIKLHPAEKIKDYNDLKKYENVYLFFEANNNEFIKLADFCLCQASTLIQNIIAMGKSFIDLNIISLNLFYVNGVDLCAKSIGIKNSCQNWEDLRSSLDELFDKNFKPLDNILENRIINDEKCYKRTIDFIKYLIRLTNLRQHA